MCEILSKLLFEIFIFCPKIQLWFSERIVDFFGVKNSWKCCGFGLFSCWQLWFHEKNCQKNLGWKTREMLGFCQNWIFGQKFYFSNSVQELQSSKSKSLLCLHSLHKRCLFRELSVSPWISKQNRWMDRLHYSSSHSYLKNFLISVKAQSYSTTHLTTRSFRNAQLQLCIHKTIYMALHLVLLVQ